MTKHKSFWLKWEWKKRVALRVTNKEWLSWQAVHSVQTGSWITLLFFRSQKSIATMPADVRQYQYRYDWFANDCCLPLLESYTIEDDQIVVSLLALLHTVSIIVFVVFAVVVNNNGNKTHRYRWFSFCWTHDHDHSIETGELNNWICRIVSKNIR